MRDSEKAEGHHLNFSMGRMSNIFMEEINKKIGTKMLPENLREIEQAVVARRSEFINQVEVDGKKTVASS